MCAVLPGPGINITGTGSIGDPWVISSPSSATGTISLSDSESIDFVVDGTGTVNDPYVITAHVKADTLLDWSSNDEVALTITGSGTAEAPYVLSATLPMITLTGGTVGNVLTQMADGSFAPGPAAQTAPGAIFTGPSLVGDGTVAEPLNVRICSYGELKALCAP